MRRGALAAPLAAVASLATAVSCCLPFGYFLAAAGVAGAGAAFNSVRPWLIGLSVLLLLAGFVRTYAGRECRLRRTRTGVAVLWTSTAVVLGLLLLPRFVGAVVPRQVPAGQPQLATLSVADFQKQFNDAADQVRIVTLLSPT